MKFLTNLGNKIKGKGKLPRFEKGDRVRICDYVDAMYKEKGTVIRVDRTTDTYTLELDRPVGWKKNLIGNCKDKDLEEKTYWYVSGYRLQKIKK